MDFKFEAGGITDVGLKRGHNEDSILVAEEDFIFAVADGMGGHAAGEVASSTAIIEFHNHMKDLEENESRLQTLAIVEELPAGICMMAHSIQFANNQVCELAEKNPDYFGMGTTMAAIYFSGEHAFVGHVGDSRVYLFRDNKLEGLTEDHSWVNEQMRKNVLNAEEAKTHRWRNVITRALGNRLDVEVDVSDVEIKTDDLYLLCSDGLTSMIEDSDIETWLQNGHLDLNRSCQKLVDMANDAGGLDNISVVLVRIGERIGEGGEESDSKTAQPPKRHPSQEDTVDSSMDM